MSRIAIGFVLLDITDDEYVETRVIGHMCPNTRNRHEDDPRDEPYRKEDFAHHSKEANEEVGIHAIDGFYVPVVCFKDRQRPRYETMGKPFDPFTGRVRVRWVWPISKYVSPFDGGDGPRFVYCSKARS
jgi:hypothetical protein